MGGVLNPPSSAAEWRHEDASGAAMFEYKSGAYSHRLQRAFIVIALVVAVVFAVGLGMSGILKGQPQFNNIY